MYIFLISKIENITGLDLLLHHPLYKEQTTILKRIEI